MLLHACTLVGRKPRRVGGKAKRLSKMGEEVKPSESEGGKDSVPTGMSLIIHVCYIMNDILY